MHCSKLDWLTPPVTLYYRGELIHSSVVSVILSLIGYCSSIVIGVYLSWDFFQRKSPTVFYFNRYVEDSGIYPINSEGVFNIFHILDTSTAVPRPIDFTYIRIIGTELSIQTYLERNNTPRDDHWIYGLCDNGTDIKGLEYLYDYPIFNQSYCIKKYYKAEAKKYYPINDENFRWPHADRGTSHPNKTFYGIVFENCKNDELRDEMTGGQPCKSETEIKQYIDKYYVRFYMADHYPDVYNYKKPFSKYLYNIDSTLASGSYTYNHINFNPSKIVTHNGLFFDNDVEEKGYIFDQNAVETGTYHGAYLAFYFWLKNTLLIYERTYKKVQDVLAEIEGMIDLIIFIVTIINNFVSDFVTLKDTSHVLFTLRTKNVNKTEITRMLYTKRRSMFIKDDPPRKKNAPVNYYYVSSKNDDNSHGFRMSSNRQRLGNSKLSRKDNIFYQRTKESSNNLANRLTRNPGYSGFNIRENEQRDKNKVITAIDIYNDREKIEKNETRKEEEKIDREDHATEENIEPEFDPFKETKISFSDFVFNYFFFCAKKKNSIETYENFRMKIISEENMIQNYLDIHTINKTLDKINKEEEEIEKSITLGK